MATTLAYPEAFVLQTIAQEMIADLTLDDVIFKYMPIVKRNVAKLLIRQLDNFTGLQQARGLDGEPASISKIGFNTYESIPGVYGEFGEINETELTTRAPLDNLMGTMDITALVMPIQQQLMSRFVNRVRNLLWSALQGSLSVMGPNGSILHTDTYTPRSYAAAISWSDAVNSTPLQDLRNLTYFEEGSSSSFGADALIYVNRRTANNLIANRNPADLFGRRTTGLGTFNSLNQVNELFTADGLPNIAIYNKSYFDDTATHVFHYHIPIGVGIAIGERPNSAPIGEYQIVRNANNPNMEADFYMQIINNIGKSAPPARVQVHCGHNGGPVLLFGTAVVNMAL